MENFACNKKLVLSFEGSECKKSSSVCLSSELLYYAICWCLFKSVPERTPHLYGFSPREQDSFYFKILSVSLLGQSSCIIFILHWIPDKEMLSLSVGSVGSLHCSLACTLG